MPYLRTIVIVVPLPGYFSLHSVLLACPLSFFIELYRFLVFRCLNPQLLCLHGMYLCRECAADAVCTSYRPQALAPCGMRLSPISIGFTFGAAGVLPVLWALPWWASGILVEEPAVYLNSRLTAVRPDPWRFV